MPAGKHINLTPHPYHEAIKTNDYEINICNNFFSRHFQIEPKKANLTNNQALGKDYFLLSLIQPTKTHHSSENTRMT